MPGDDFSAYTHHNAFQSKFHEKVYFVKPIGNVSKIDITWCLEPMIEVSWRIELEFATEKKKDFPLIHSIKFFFDQNRISNVNQTLI